MGSQNYSTYQKCASCDSQIEIRIIGNKNNPEHGMPIVRHRKKQFCSVECQNIWQNSIPWEDRIGKERAEAIRLERSEQLKKNNPHNDPEVAEKISIGIKKYLKENPDARIGENNGFYGKTHSKETIEHWIDTKSGKLSYDEEQQQKQKNNTPKKENHPNWLGGISNGEYGMEFDKNLKKEIKESYNYTCQLCKIETEILDVHHIDYDKTNNTKNNLIPLCKVCHGKTNYNREKWKEIFEFIQNS